MSKNGLYRIFGKQAQKPNWKLEEIESHVGWRSTVKSTSPRILQFRMRYTKDHKKYLRKPKINHFMLNRQMRSGLTKSNSWNLGYSRRIKGIKDQKHQFFYNKTAIEGKMDLPRNRLPHARPDIRPNDIAIVRLLRLQTSIFQKKTRENW